MAGTDTPNSPVVRVGDTLGPAYDRCIDRIRDRAYQLFLDRGEGSGDPEADWFAAQDELLSSIDLELTEHKKNLVVEANVEGFSRDEIEVQLEGATLTVFGSRETDSRKAGKKGDKGPTVIGHVSFCQSLTLPAAVDPERSHAKLQKNGKLKITLPRQESVK